MFSYKCGFPFRSFICAFVLFVRTRLENRHMPVTVLIEFVVRRHRYQHTIRHTKRVEYLCTSFTPHLNITTVTQIFLYHNLYMISINDYFEKLNENQYSLLLTINHINNQEQMSQYRFYIPYFKTFMYM